MRTLYLPYERVEDEATGTWCVTGCDRTGRDFGVGVGPTVAEAEGRLREWVLDSLLAAAVDGEDRLGDLLDAAPSGPAIEFGMVDLIPIRLRLLRALRGLSQAQVGARLGLTQQAYAKLERPGANIQLRTLELVQGVLDGDPLSLDEGAKRALVAPAHRGPTRLITTADVVQWSQRIEAKWQFPVLIYRLIWGSSSRLRDLHFPSGESVYSGGFDGHVVAFGDHPHVPDGLSVWELGTERGVRGKAEKDFAKRLAAGAALPLEQVTYVAVTARSSTVIGAWAEEKGALGLWRDVRGYDAGRLAQWIDSLPAVAMWVGGLIGKVPAGVHDPASWWFDWSNLTAPATSPALVLAGQDEAVRSVRDWAAGPPAPLAVRAVTDEDAVAVSTAALRDALPLSSGTTRAWVVTSRDAWDLVTASAEPLVLVAAFADRAGVESAVSRGHHVLVPLDNGSPGDGAVNVAPRPRDTVRAVLESMGVETPRLDELTEVARLSLSAVRRKLARVPALMAPPWAKAGSAEDLIPGVLVGAWDDANEADRAAVAELAGAPYDSVLADMRRWANGADPPVRQVGSYVELVDRMDAWVLTHRQVGREHLERWARVAVEVLGELDPKFELPLDQQYAAAVYGKQLRHSLRLRQGLAETIALLGAASDSHPPAGQLTGQEWACRVVRSLFGRPGGWHLWASVSPLLQLVAEACPDTFMEALERALEDAEFAERMFTDRGYTFFHSSPHTGLLWALEVLAWSPEHLGAATQLLGTLAMVEPAGGRLANRPVASLAEIFKLWHPCTSAPAAVRHAALTALAESVPAVAWRVLKGILPMLMAIAHPTAAPRWRNWTVEPYGTGVEVAAGMEFAVDLMLQLAAASGDRWASMVELLDDIPTAAFDRVLQGLSLDSTQLAEVERAKVWDRLRQVTGRHREFPDARWALPSSRVEQMERVLEEIAPTDLLLLHGWLFTEWPKALGRRRGDWNADREQVARQRSSVARDVLASGGMEALLKFAGGVDAPWTVGWALVDVVGTDDAVGLLAPLLESGKDLLMSVGTGVVGALAATGPGRLVSILNGRQWEAAAAVELLRFMPFGPVTWALVDAESLQLQRLYWERVNVYQHLQPDGGVLAAAAGALVHHQLHEKAVHLMVANIDAAPPELIATVLHAAAFGGREEPLHVEHIANEVPMLLEALTERMRDTDLVADLEWAYLPLLHTPVHRPRGLIARLQHDPSFFVRALECMYRRSDEEPQRDASQADREHAARAFNLLHEWRDPPGCAADGTVHESELRAWVTEARRLAAEVARAEVADVHIGQVLAHLPAGPEGWPPDLLGRILQDCRSHHLDDGVATGLSNKQGFTTRGLHDGGRQERDLARDYSEAASRVSARFPRLGRVLRSVASTYEHLGRREDVNAEVR